MSHPDPWLPPPRPYASWTHFPFPPPRMATNPTLTTLEIPPRKSALLVLSWRAAALDTTILSDRRSKVSGKSFCLIGIGSLTCQLLNVRNPAFFSVRSCLAAWTVRKTAGHAESREVGESVDARDGDGARASPETTGRSGFLLTRILQRLSPEVYDAIQI